VKTLHEDLVDGVDHVRSAAVRFDFDQSYRYWSGWGDLDLAGLGRFEGIGAGVLLAPIGTTMGSGASGIMLTLSGLTPELAALVTSQNYRERPAQLWRLYFAADRVTFLGVRRFYVGRVGPIAEEEEIGGAVSLAIPIEGGALAYSRAGARNVSAPDQALLGGPNDKTLRKVGSVAEKQLNWGALPPGAAGASVPATPGVADFRNNPIAAGILF
jgi:hypothetical protein